MLRLRTTVPRRLLWPWFATGLVWLALPALVSAQTASTRPTTVSVQVTGHAAEKGGTPGAFTFTRQGVLDQTLEVDYQIDGTAIDGTDYGRLPLRVVFPAGEAVVRLSVYPAPDRISEPEETVVITLRPRSQPFSMVVLPDTQYYTGDVHGGSPEMLTAQAQWIAAHRDELNIAFVLHEGDVTERNELIEWQRARLSLDYIEEAVPYAIVPGNHDGLGGPGNPTARFNHFFPYESFSQRPSFGGVFESNRMDNSFHLFSAGGVDWLVLALEYGPRNTVLEWANEVVARHAERKVILLTHAHVYLDNALHGSSTNHQWLPTKDGRENDGTDVWEKLLRRHRNVVLAFSGHILGRGTGRLVGTGDAGNQVLQMLANYQEAAAGGSGYLRIVQFHPEADKLAVRTYSPYLERSLTDPENQFEYTGLGLFTNSRPAYLISPVQAASTLVITNDDLSGEAPDVVAVKAGGLPPVLEVTFDRPLERGSAEDMANYAVSGGLRLMGAKLGPDPARVVLTTDSELPDGTACTLTVKGVKNLAGGLALTVPVTRPFLYHRLLLSNDFSGNTLAGWTIVDEGRVGRPSMWIAKYGRLFQLSNIYGPDTEARDHRQGTFACWTESSALQWSNYVAEVLFKSGDDDGVGLLFRYQNPSNYYKLDLDSQKSFRKLFKMVDGVESALATEAGGYSVSRDHWIRVEARGAELSVRLDGAVLFGGPVMDASLAAGTVGLYCWGDQGVVFDDLVVSPLR